MRTLSRGRRVGVASGCCSLALPTLGRPRHPESRKHGLTWVSRERLYTGQMSNSRKFLLGDMERRVEVSVVFG